MSQALLDPYHHISLLPVLSLSLFLRHTLLPRLRIIVFTLYLYCHPHHTCSFFLNLLLLFSFALSVLLISLAISIISLFSLSLMSPSSSYYYTTARIPQIVPSRPVLVMECPKQAATEKRVPRHVTGSEIVKLLKSQT